MNGIVYDQGMIYSTNIQRIRYVDKNWKLSITVKVDIVGSLIIWCIHHVDVNMLLYFCELFVEKWIKNGVWFKSDMI